jgi:thiol-disulfide isomerase/thioredoxin
MRVASLTLLLAGAVAAWFCRDSLRNRVLTKGVMLNDAPTGPAMEQVIDAARDQQATLRALWNTKKIVHREAAVRQLSRFIPADKPIPVQWESWVLAAALDPDTDVRESALGILSEHQHPALAAICMAQLQDCDPEVRLLGLNHLKQVSAGVGVPILIPLLKDPDPRVLALGLNLLEHWTGQVFGVKLVETVPSENKETGLIEYSEEGNARAKAGAARANSWWAEHQAQFTSVQLEVPSSVLAALEPVPAGDFTLSTLDGRKVRLSEFHGKVVLINFWTTWCTACVSEMPELIELQKRHSQQIVILGVSLDCVPDDDDGLGQVRPPLTEIRHKVAHFVAARKINYTILLDDKSNVGGRFNGGELPTTVIVDAEGNVRRRFVGARSLPVFEAMLAEAGGSVRQTMK